MNLRSQKLILLPPRFFPSSSPLFPSEVTSAVAEEVVEDDWGSVWEEVVGRRKIQVNWRFLQQRERHSVTLEGENVFAAIHGISLYCKLATLS